MPVESNGHPSARENGHATRIKVAAAGDVHCSESNRDATARAFNEIDGSVDLILLAGDLTTHGEPHQGSVLADACRDLQTPVIAVLGNHDWHADRARELTEVLEDGGIEMIDRSHTIKQPKGVEVGIVGAKGYVGGFAGCHIPD